MKNLKAIKFYVYQTQNYIAAHEEKMDKTDKMEVHMTTNIGEKSCIWKSKRPGTGF